MKYTNKLAVLVLILLFCFAQASAAELDRWLEVDHWPRRVKDLQKRYPDFESEIIGKSHMGRPLLMLSLGAKQAERHMLWVCGQHGDEVYVTQSCVLLLQQLLHLERSDRQWSQFFQHTRLSLLPIANPDGLAKRTRTNAAGVNLNANWNWGRHVELPEARAQEFRRFGQLNYGGPKAFSEPESRALRDWILAQRQLDLLVDLHTGVAPFAQGLVLFPFAAEAINTLNQAQQQQLLPLARQFATVLSVSDSPLEGFTALQAHGIPAYLQAKIRALVPPEHLQGALSQLPQNGQSPGAMIDWVYGRLGIPALAFEIFAYSEDVSDSQYPLFLSNHAHWERGLMQILLQTGSWSRV